MPFNSVIKVPLVPSALIATVELVKLISLVAVLENDTRPMRFSSPFVEPRTIAPKSFDASTAFSSLVSPSGTVAGVDFYANGSLIGPATFNAVSGKWERAWNSVPPGGYALSAVATDNGSAGTPSSPVNITLGTAVTIEPGVDGKKWDGTFTLTRGGDVSGSMTVSLQVDTAAGTAIEGSAFTLPATVRFYPGQSAKTVTVNVNNDALREGAETITLAVLPGTGYGPGTSSSATIQILDDELTWLPPGDGLSATSYADKSLFSEALRRVGSTVDSSSGHGSPDPAVPSDLPEPEFLHATAQADELSTVYLRYSEPMDPTEAANPSKYTLSDGLHVTGAAINGEKTVVTLSCSGSVP